MIVAHHDYGGLFGELGEDAVVRDLGIIDATVNAKGADRNNPGEHGVGVLAGVKSWSHISHIQHRSGNWRGIAKAHWRIGWKKYGTL